MHADTGDCTVLVLLDLNATFDTVEHIVSIESLRQWMGISGTTLAWFSSYLYNRTFVINIGKHI